MKTLLEIKNLYAQEQGYEDWRELQEYHSRNPREIEYYMNEICILAQKEALRKQKEEFISEIVNRADSLHKISLTKKGKEKIPFESAVTSFIVFKIHIKSSITNEQNLIQ